MVQKSFMKACFYIDRQHILIYNDIIQYYMKGEKHGKDKRRDSADCYTVY